MTKKIEMHKRYKLIDKEGWFKSYSTNKEIYADHMRGDILYTDPRKFFLQFDKLYTADLTRAVLFENEFNKYFRGSSTRGEENNYSLGWFF